MLLHLKQVICVWDTARQTMLPSEMTQGAIIQHSSTSRTVLVFSNRSSYHCLTDGPAAEFCSKVPIFLLPRQNPACIQFLREVI